MFRYTQSAQSVIDDTPTEELTMRRNAFRLIAVGSGVLSVLSGKIAYEVLNQQELNGISIGVGTVCVTASLAAAINTPVFLHHAHLVTQAIDERSQ